MGIIHRDIKPSNILLFKNQNDQFPVAKIADLGLVRFVAKQEQTFTQEIQSLAYRAPEVLLGNKHYNHAIDLWSMGVLAYELIHGLRMFTGSSEIDTLINIFHYKGKPQYEGFTYRKDYENLSSEFIVKFPNL